ncbi:MAG TPA: hypothetical protein VMV44_09570, partial [Rectinemataceae bacterium]|nr:hypothetical protein [Rectinemataceae bacterium]
RELRDPSLLKGRCGVCEYKVVCGGQRGRAWAMTGDYLETDPACIYVPSAPAPAVDAAAGADGAGAGSAGAGGAEK